MRKYLQWAAAAAAGLVIGLSTAQGATAEAPVLTTPAGVTVYEDGSVHVEDSAKWQEARAQQWLANCDVLGNGRCE